MGYAEAGPANGPAVILLHGWPYDIYSYVDVDPVTANFMYAVQQLILASTFETVMGTPAWKTLPSWYLVNKHDQAIAPDLERFMAKRMSATTMESDSNHVAMVSHPGNVADLILRAAESVAEKVH